MVMFFLYPHEIMHLIFRQHIAILFVLIKYKQMNHCIELSWNYVEGLAEFVMIIFSPLSPLRGSTCVCQGKPLSVMWSFLSGGRWSWVKTARWNSYFYPFIFNLTHRFWTQCIFLIINYTLYQGKVLVLNSFLFIKPDA